MKTLHSKSNIRPIKRINGKQKASFKEQKDEIEEYTSNEKFYNLQK